MPTYEYRCPNGHDFERFAKISESQSTLPCPQCGAQAERRISGGAGLVFKGSGFYITDYGKDGKKDQKPAAAKAGDGASDSSGGASAGEAKGGDAKGGDAKGDAKSGAKSGGDAAKSAPAPAAAPAKPSSSSGGEK